MFEPDIVVTERGDYAERFIVVEVKSTPAALDEVEADLRSYMVQNSFQLGVLVAPGQIRLYRDRYLSYEPESVERIGTYELSEFDHFANPPPRDRSEEMARLEAAVQGWIESLPSGETLDVLDEPLRTVLANDFAPYVRYGEVRAAHHRYRNVRAPESRLAR